MADDDYQVGYGKPPKHARFKKGQSGNPKGRPKGSLNFKTAIGKVLSSKVDVKKGGKTYKMPVIDAMAARLAERALTGDPKAVREFINLAGLHDDPATAAALEEPMLQEDIELLRLALARNHPNPDTSNPDTSNEG